MMDTLVNEAAELPRRHGFAPKNEEMYTTESARKAARYLHEIIGHFFYYIHSVLGSNPCKTSIVYDHNQNRWD